LHARGALQRQDHPDYGQIVVQHSPIRFANVPLRALEPSRRLGADTERMLADRLGMSDHEVAAVVPGGKRA
jgi:formyl-CoA transferase